MIPGIIASQLLTQEGEEFGFANVSLLMSWDGTDGATTATDDSIYAHVPTFTGAVIDDAQFVFNESVLFGSATDHIHFPYHPSFHIGTQPFCIEGRARFSSVSGTRQLIGLHDTGGSLPRRSWRVVLSNGLGGMYFGSSTDGSTESLNMLIAPGGQDAGDFVTNTWYAWCFERDTNDVLRGYLNGTMIASVTGFTADLFNLTAKDLVMGANGDAQWGFLGWQDEMRLIVGHALYANDSGYTLLAMPFPRPGEIVAAVGTAAGIGSASGISQEGTSVGAAAGTGMAVGDAQTILAIVGAASGVGTAVANGTVVADEVLVTYQTAAQDGSNLTTYTYASQAIGTANASRWVIVGAITSNQSVNVSSMTIGGISATFVGRITVGICRAEVWKANVPTGTTATIAVTQAGAGDRSAIGVATTDGPVATIEVDGMNTSRLANASNVSVNTVDGGFIFGIGIHHNASGAETLSARGMTLQNESFIEAASIRVGVATAITTGAAASVGFDLNGGVNDNFDSPYIVVSFGPG